MRAVRRRVGDPEQRPAQPGPAPVLSRLFSPVDIASLVYFRIAFGALMLIEILRYFGHGWVRAHYIDPGLNFSYYGFEWVRPWPGEWMTVHFAVLGVLAVLIAVGLWYRVAAALFFLGFTYVFLLESANYLNHFYLILLFALLMIFVPAHRAFSFDSSRRPGIHSLTAPAWSLWALRFQMGIVYLFGGIAKLNGDWLDGNPLRLWLAARTDFPIIGGLFDQEWLILLFVYGSLLLDLFAFPLLLWSRTRTLTFVALVAFHLMNANLFKIGIFPWVAIAATALFFPPSWPRRLFARRRRRRVRGRPPKKVRTQDSAPAGIGTWRRVTVTLLALYVAVQVLVPLRHFAYPGEVSWTEEGHRFSWHMMLRTKQHRARFFVTPSDTGSTFEVDPFEHLARWQYETMGKRPYLILQFAHYLSDVYTPAGDPPAEVRAHVVESLNGGLPQMLIDPRVDLAREEAGLGTADWIVPFGDDLWVPPPGSSAASLAAYIEEELRARSEALEP